mgnify:CR=1 FL=1
MASNAVVSIIIPYRYIHAKSYVTLEANTFIIFQMMVVFLFLVTAIGSFLMEIFKARSCYAIKIMYVTRDQ